VDLEQQVIPTLVVSHVSTLQLLIAYFRKSPVEEAMQIEVPLHTVIKFTPVRGGGWKESMHELAPVYERANSISGMANKVSIEGMDTITEKDPTSPSPIWGDHMRKPSSSSFGQGSHSRSSSGGGDGGPEVPHLTSRAIF
jgi:hypothetical protein